MASRLLSSSKLFRKCKKLLTGDLCTPRQIDQFKSLLYTHLNKNYSNRDYDVTRLSADMQLSKFKFLRICWWCLGQSPKALIDAFRLEKTEELIEEGVYSVSEAAYIAGFKNFSYFSECYRKKNHQSLFQSKKILEKSASKRSLIWFTLP